MSARGEGHKSSFLAFSPTKILPCFEPWFFSKDLHQIVRDILDYRLDMKRRLRECLALQPTQADGIRLKKRYLDLKENLFLFLEDPTIPKTNNSSEQAFRMSKLFMKVTNCFRSDWGKELFAGVRSVINTGKRQGLNAYKAITRALSPFGPFFGTQPAQE